jgi:N-acetylglucosaminyl-diphospho-decaprenol L-rhamnosyltransferase
MSDRRVAVVIATRNRRPSLLRTLERLCDLPEWPRVVVVDNASSDGSADAARRMAGVEVIELAENLGAAARTVGAEHVGEPYVAFSDDDSWWAPGALTRAADLLDRHGDLALIAARILVGPDEREDPTCALMERSPLRTPTGLPGTPILGFVACAAVARRSAFLSAGGFYARLGFVGEEQLLAVDLARAGWRLAYVPDVVAHHYPSPRDDHVRRRLAARNGLLVAWLRRPLGGAARATAGMLARGLRDPATRAGALEALRVLPAIARERRPVPRELELDLRRIGA